jgi:hypothetical protein
MHGISFRQLRRLDSLNCAGWLGWHTGPNQSWVFWRKKMCHLLKKTLVTVWVTTLIRKDLPQLPCFKRARRCDVWTGSLWFSPLSKSGCAVGAVDKCTVMPPSEYTQHSYLQRGYLLGEAVPIHSSVGWGFEPCLFRRGWLLLCLDTFSLAANVSVI